MGNWLIRNVSKECKKRIKKEAQDVGLTIAEYLNVLLGHDINKIASNNWLIKGVPNNTKRDLIVNARNRKISLGQYLTLLAENDRERAKDESNFRKVKRFIDEL